MSSGLPASRRGNVLAIIVIIVALAVLCGLLALGVFILVDGWRALDRVTPAPDSVPSFDLAASLAGAMVLSLGFFVAEHAGDDLSDKMTLVILVLASLCVSFYMLFRPVHYRGRYSCGSWIAPSRYVRHYNISGYCVAHLDASFRWACLAAAVALVFPLIIGFWYMVVPQSFRDRFTESGARAT